ncbi:hypothetical protein KK141_09225 [Dyella sp. LX-66]|uniref:hypothetical protein n=1 Tax=unclassified Dyella TaxID=2634549 RepID=UPI001BE08048|nr:MULTISPECIES: hypothetical protein [unclassified Dyella]MBT2115899.1 hypothetical protein [Dyella sp. LX-1]MBT2139714.1 hypothetical protein [Dyella sp. LX-66]
MHSNGGGGGGGQGNPFDSIGKRKGRIGRTTKKNMTLTAGLVAPELKKGFDEYKKRGSRNSASGEQIDAAHRFSDHGIRSMFRTFGKEALAPTMAHSDFRHQVTTFVDSVWDPQLQSRVHNAKVDTARDTLFRGHSTDPGGGKARLSYLDVAKIGEGVSTLANHSIKNIGPGLAGPNRSIGKAPDQRFMMSPKGQNLVNTPKTREQRRAVEGAVVKFNMPMSPSLNYRDNPRGSSQPKLPRAPVFSPMPAAKKSTPTAASSSNAGGSGAAKPKTRR